MLNKALHFVRKYHRINQVELATKLGISSSYLSEIESGKKNININLLKKYSTVFTIPMSSLLLFSENLSDNTFSERSRVVITEKIIKIMEWLNDSDTLK